MASRGEREPRPMGDLMKMLVAGRGWGERMALGRLRGSWRLIVGEQVARRSEPVRLARGTLTLRVEAGAWANELTLLAPALARKADEYLGGGAVHEIKVSAGPPTRPAEEVATDP